MKRIIHIDVPDNGEVHCYEKHGRFISAILALYALWRHGEGSIEITNEKAPEEMMVS